MSFSRALKSGAFLATVATVSLMSGAASAQVSTQAGSADAGRFSEDKRQQLQVPQATPQISIKQMELVNAPKGAENITFKFGGMSIEGNSVYSDEELASLYQDKIGQTITLADFYRIANAITLKYRDDGYILTQTVVPPQTIDKGLPTVRVVEGVIGNVTLQADGQSQKEADLIRSYLNQIPRDKALNVRDMERQLLLVNDLPGVEARAIISPSPSATGAADMLIIVNRDSFEGEASIDNLGSKFLGRWELGGAMTANSILGNNESLSVQASYAPGTGYELLYGAASYEQPVGIYGTRVGALVSATKTDPGYTLTQFDVNGRAMLYSAYVRHPFIRSRNENLFGRLTFDVRNVESSNNIENDRNDHIRAIRASANYDFLDTMIGTAVNSLSAQVSRGLGIFNASEEGDFTSRPSGDSNFTKLELQAQRLQSITDSVNLLLIARGQKSSNALLGSEEFGLGGAYIGRGYDPSEITGDDGIAGQAEFQWNNPLTLPANYGVDHLQLYTFADAGSVWNKDATTSDDKRDSLFSTGVGARVDFTYDIKLDLGVAVPMTREIGTTGDTSPRYYLNVNKKF